jgi:hypothetical protein
MDTSIAAHESSRRLAELLRHEQYGLAEFLVALAEFDRERLWLPLGHASLFSFLHRELGLSNAAAHYRKVAVGLIRDFPEVVEPLRHGKLCLTSVADLAREMTPENRAEVLPRFFHRSRPRPGGLEVRTVQTDLLARLTYGNDWMDRAPRPLRARHPVRTLYGWRLEP